MGKHFVPQEYLRGFASSTNGSHVWMFDKHSRTWSHPAIKRAAQSRDYYSAEVEAWLTTDVERLGHIALNALRNGRPLNETQLEDLTYYVAVMLMRGPLRRRKAIESVSVVLRSVIEDSRRELEAQRTASNNKLISARIAEFERVEAMFLAETPANVQQQIKDPRPSENVYGAVSKMAWRVVQAPADSFVFTADNPAYFFEGLGVGTPEAEITFPIDSKHALLGSHQGERGSIVRMIARRPLIKEVNRRIASGAERFVFSPRKEQWIETLALRRKPYLSRIQWQD